MSYIEREAARDLMEQAIADDWEIQYADDRLDEIPAADVVEVVRCRECGAFRPLKEGGLCWNTGYYVPEDGYCHDGERKGGDE